MKREELGGYPPGTRHHAAPCRDVQDFRRLDEGSSCSELLLQKLTVIMLALWQTAASLLLILRMHACICINMYTCVFKICLWLSRSSITVKDVTESRTPASTAHNDSYSTLRTHNVKHIPKMGVIRNNT